MTEAQKEQRIRAYRLMRLRGMYRTAQDLFVRSESTLIVQGLIDEQIVLLGGESEKERRINARQKAIAHYINVF